MSVFEMSPQTPNRLHRFVNQRLPTAPHYRYAENLEDPNVRGYDAIRRLCLIEIAKVADELAGKRAR